MPILVTRNRIQESIAQVIIISMEEFSKKKGKAGTRGQQQIARENVETITFYRNMILGSNGIFFLMMTILGANYFKTEIVMFFGMVNRFSPYMAMCCF